ncbi:IS1595 family transposase [Agrobacterium vitis]|nr:MULTISPECIES: IS1595 family transposase [Rhizobium/Agrobacterium group]MCF1481637.1 IS1595 family transposase [Allorhizobium ampelinum]NSZ42592.1 IS1595 family transposase [Agrobacterium vitis]NTA26300.1 IS1595 family transposase [Allorhizobium ampelinum]
MLNPKARNLDPEAIWALTEDEAYALFVDFRWADNAGEPNCPRCGCFEPYSIRRRRFRCSEAECRAEFSVTSGTVFANRKLSFKKIIMAIWEEITAAKGMAALHLTRKLNTQYKTAYVLLQKLREAVGLRRTAVTLQGLVQIDGKYVGGVLRKANKKEDRKDGRKRENQNGKRMCVLALREANKHAPNRTLTRVIMDENGKDAWAAVAKHVDPKALLIADEHKAYDDLGRPCLHAPREPQPAVPGRRRHELERDRELLQPRRESLQGYQSSLLHEVPRLVHGNAGVEGGYALHGLALAVRRCPPYSHVKADVEEPVWLLARGGLEYSRSGLGARRPTRRTVDLP